MSLDLARLAARAAASKTSEATLLLEVGPVLGITDYFIVTSGRNARQVRAVVDEVLRQLREAAGRLERRIEGQHDAKWVLIDYGDFVVHIFDEESRDYYALERLWADVDRVEFDERVAEESLSAEGGAR